jgi:predicted AAA+ superfamily ATPase
MAITNLERVGKALEYLNQGLRPFVEREMQAAFGDKWTEQATQGFPDGHPALKKGKVNWDTQALLSVMWNRWQDVFRKTLGNAERSLVSELRDARNNWAHQQAFSGDDAYRALDTTARLLTAVSAANEAAEVEKMKMELLRVRYDDQIRIEKRKQADTGIESAAAPGLKPWREVVTPHADVCKGTYQQAEFAADLWQVYLKEGADEYRMPSPFFSRTFLTIGLTDLLVSALQRLSGTGGDPVIELQTNFGGGKTHSMLALFHLFSGTPVSELAGIEPVMKKAGVTKIPTAQRVVIVGNKLSPGQPEKKKDGTVVHTLWGELAWQLGGKEGYAIIKKADETATNPGDKLRELFNQYSPCLILIDEWVAYARQLHDNGDLPGGTFETHFTFAQTLSEAAKAAKNTLLVVSIPASESGQVSPHGSEAEDVEVGGERGRAALSRLKNAIGRVESSWRPASAEEGFEIVRRRLFEPMIERAQFVARDTVAKAFADLYRSQASEFPGECRDGDYEQRLKAAYPIHPEVFDRLYTDWSSLIKFQRTRGVLRLMAAVIHSLWRKEDRNPLIMPASISIDDPRVQFELTRYLSDNWPPVIEKDVDGPNALPLRIDGEQPNLGKYSACRRVARTIYLGSAPITKAATRGLEDRRVKLGCVMPGESPAIFGDALRRMSQAATFLYQDGTRYWYDTQPTVTKTAEDRANQLKSKSDVVAAEIKRRVDNDLRQRGDFDRTHSFPASHADVPDETDARLVVLGADHPHTKDENSPAVLAAKGFLDSRGNSPRIYKNTLVFLAVDKTKLSDLDEAVRRYLAWQSITDEAQQLDLTPFQQKQAITQRDNADTVVKTRLPESYQWLIVPTQTTPQDDVALNTYRLTGQEALAIRASKKLKTESQLVTKFGATALRHELDRVLWRENHVEIRQLAEDFPRYTYLPRLKDTGVLIEAIREGLGMLSWVHDSFAFAENYDKASNRYQGLRVAQNMAITADGFFGLLVKPEPALKQYEAEKAAATGTGATPPVKPGDQTGTAKPGGGTGAVPVPQPAEPTKPKRFHGTVQLDASRVGRDAGKIAQEVVAHLTGLLGSDVKVTLEIEATMPTGTPDNVVRTVTENCRTLKFYAHGFEKE